VLTAPPSAKGASADAEARPPDPPTATATQRLLRLAKAAGITVLGLALTAWLLPAMTRQWDDRQKEHELKASVIADMASATARALVAGEAIWPLQSTPRVPKASATQWDLSALEIAARLGSYFSPSVVASWEIYSWAVDRFINAGSVSASAALTEAVGTKLALDPGVADAAAQLLAPGSGRTVPSTLTFGLDPSGRTPGSDAENLAKLDKMLSPELGHDQAAFKGLAAWTYIERQLLGLEQAVAAQVLHSHATGFSTTTGNLLRDLVP
jgi:hypothetical protein